MHTDQLSLVTRQADRLIVDALLFGSSMTLQELVAATGLSSVAIAGVTATLLRNGWAQETSIENESGSETTIRYELAADAAYSFGVDLGGTKVAAAIGDFAGRIVAELEEPTDPRGEQFVVDQICELAKKLAKKVGIDFTKIDRVMVGAPGAVDPATGKVSLSPNIAGLGRVDVLQSLRQHFGPIVSLDNDANLAVVGEVSQGSARGRHNAALLALGTGVGLGLIINGRLVHGASGAAGEIAYLPIGRDLTSESALITGAFELEVGSVGIVQRYRLAGGRASIGTVREIFRAVEEGDAVAIAVLDQTARSIALAVVALQAILDLEIVVLGGSIGVNPKLVKCVQFAMSAVFARPVIIVASTLGSRAGLVGAVYGAVSDLHDHYFGIVP